MGKSPTSLTSQSLAQAWPTHKKVSMPPKKETKSRVCDNRIPFCKNTIALLDSISLNVLYVIQVVVLFTRLATHETRNQNFNHMKPDLCFRTWYFHFHFGRLMGGKALTLKTHARKSGGTLSRA